MVNSRPYTSVWCVTEYIPLRYRGKRSKGYVVRDNGVVGRMTQASRIVLCADHERLLLSVAH